MGLTLDPREMVRNLDASYKQIVEISRALLMDAKIIIMDEPTTSLTDPEIENVFAILRQLRQQKVGIVFISHKLREVMEICDTYTVLRDGVMVASGMREGCDHIAIWRASWSATTCAQRNSAAARSAGKRDCPCAGLRRSRISAISI